MFNEPFQGENEAVRLLAKYYLDNEEVKLLTQLFKSNIDLNRIMGSLIMHRVIGSAWMTIKDHDIRSLAKKDKNDDFFYYLSNFFEAQQNRAEEQLNQTKKLINIFNKENIDYAILKGISLGLDLYETPGIRWFNDVDILLRHDDVNNALSYLKSIGYVQGEYNFINKKIELANRKDIVSSPLLSHEVFPLVKSIPECSIKFHEVDIQFSLDLLTSNRTDELVNNFLNRKISLEEHGNLKTLSPEDHLLFLCIHFYKEAIYLEEVMNHKDFVMYKILDIYRLLYKYKDMLRWKEVIAVAENYNLMDALKFALTYTIGMFDYKNQLIPNIIKSWLLDKENDYKELLNLVYDKSGKDKYCWCIPNNQKFFNNKRFDVLANI